MIVNPNSTQKLVQQRFQQMQRSRPGATEDEPEAGSVLDKLQDTRFLKFKGMLPSRDAESVTESDSCRKQSETVQSFARPPVGSSGPQAHSMLANYGNRSDEKQKRLLSSSSASKLLKMPQQITGQIDPLDQRINRLTEEKTRGREKVAGVQALSTEDSPSLQYQPMGGGGPLHSDQNDQNRINNPSQAPNNINANTQKQQSRNAGNYELMTIQEGEKSPRSALLKTSSKLSFGGAMGADPGGHRNDVAYNSFLVQQSKINNTASKQHLNKNSGQNNVHTNQEGLVKNRNNSFITYKNHQNERVHLFQPPAGSGPYFETGANQRPPAENPKILIQQPDSSQDMSMVSGVTASAAGAYNLSQTMVSDAYQQKGEGSKTSKGHPHPQQQQQLSSTQSNSLMSNPRYQKPTKVPIQDRQPREPSQSANPQGVRSFITATSNNTRPFSQFESALGGDNDQNPSFCESVAVPIRRSTTTGSLAQRRRSSSRKNSGVRKSKSRSKSRSKSGTSFPKERAVNQQLIQQMQSFDASSTGKIQKNQQNIEKSVDDGSKVDTSKIKTNTEIFQEMLLSTSSIQRDVLTLLEEYNQKVRSLLGKGPGSTRPVDSNHQLTQYLVDVASYPLLPKKSRSFKEIAQTQLNQLSFLLQNKMIGGPQLPAQLTQTASLTSDSQATTQQQRQEASSDQIINLKFNQTNRELSGLRSGGPSSGPERPKPSADQKIISLSYLKELKDRENDIDLYRNQIKQLMDQNTSLRSDLAEITKKHEMDRQIMRLEIGKDQFEMERNIEKICNELKSDGQLFQNLRSVISQIKYDHSERINELNDQIEQITNKKNQELQKYVEEVRLCQTEIRKLNEDRELRRRQSSCASDALLKQQYEGQHLEASFTQFGRKNQQELHAELEYFVEKTQSLEAELKTLNLELLYHRTDKDDTGRMKQQLDQALAQVRLIKNENSDLQKQKEHYQREYQIQKAQIEKQEQRIAEVIQNNNVNGGRTDLARGRSQAHQLLSDNDEDPPAPRNYGARPTQSSVNMDSAYMHHISKSQERNQEGGPRCRSRGPRTLQMDSRSHPGALKMTPGIDNQKSMQSQAAMIEKLLLKIKKLEQQKLKQDFPGIFNMDNKSEQKGTLMNDLEFKTYKEHINELYELLMKQNGASRVKEGVGKMDHEEQFRQIKSYLNLQAQMGSLKKFRFDQSFADLLCLADLQDIYDTFFNRKEKRIELGELSNLNTKSLYMNAEQQLTIKNDCFEKLYQKISENIGQFFLIYSQMQFQKDKNQTLEDQIKAMRESREVQYNDMCSTGSDQMTSQKFYQIRSMFEQERVRVQTLEIENQRILKQVQEVNQQLEFHKQFNEIDPKVVQDVTKFIVDQGLGEDADRTRKRGSQSISNKRSLQFNKPYSNIKNRSQSRKQKRSQSKVFGGKKSWVKLGDQDNLLLDLDLNEAIDKIENLQKQLEEIESENQLLQTDNKTYKHELQQLEQAMQAEAVTRQELENQNMTLQSDNTGFKNELEVCKQRLEEAEKKVERLSALNSELRVLIEEERDVNIDEVQRLEKDTQLKVKQIETRTVILKNKLTQLASQLKVYIQQTFTHEQIVDAILDHLGVTSTTHLNSRHAGSRNGSCYKQESNAGNISQLELQKNQRLGLHSSLSEVQKSEPQQPKKRKIKIDYRKKEIQEEFVNNSDYEEAMVTSNYRANIPRTLSRNMDAQSQKQMSSYECVMNGNGAAKSRNRAQEFYSGASQERPGTQDNRRNQMGQQAYKTLDPSDAHSQSQTPYPECDLPSQIHKRGVGTGGGTCPPTQQRASQARRRDQLQKDEQPAWTEYDQNQVNKKADSFEQKLKERDGKRFDDKDEAFDIRSKSKQRLDQIFSQYNNDVQNMQSTQQRPLQEPLNDQPALQNPKPDPEESEDLINPDYTGQAARNDEDYQIKVFRPKHSRSRSRQRNRSQQSHRRSVSRSNGVPFGRDVSQVAPIIDDQDQQSICSQTNSLQFEVKPMQRKTYQLPDDQLNENAMNKKSLTILGRKDSYQAFDQIRHPTSFLAPAPGSTTATGNPQRSFAVTQKIPKASVYDLDMGPSHVEKKDETRYGGGVHPQHSGIQDANQSLSLQIKEDIKRNLAVQSQFCKEREEFSNKLQALRDRMKQETFSQISNQASTSRHTSASKGALNLERDSASNAEVYKANYKY